MKSILVAGCMFLGVIASEPLLAEQSPQKPKRAWTSSVELGAVATTGNTEQRTVKFRADTAHDGPRFKHTFHADAFRSEQDSVINAEKYYTYYQADYKLNDRNAIFARLSYEDDRFSGFDYQTDITVGFNRVLLLRDNMELDGDLGAGFRHSKLDDGTSEDEAISRIALKYIWQISESAQFKQLLSVEAGATSTISRSESSIQTSIIGSLAMKLAYNVKHQSNVPVGRKNTDTESSITLVYSF